MMGSNLPSRAFCLVLLMISIVSCGGGEDVPVTPAVNEAPTAIASSEINQPRGSAITLDGSASYDPEGRDLTYQWSVVSVPPGSNADIPVVLRAVVHPSFTADLLGAYVFSLVVSDGVNESMPGEVTVIVNSVVIYANDFSSQNSLDGFILGQVGTAQVYLDQGQLRIDPGENYLNRGYAALNLASVVSEYSAIFSASAQKIVWSFNVSNVDGATCGACNNLFMFNLYSASDTNDSTGFGYVLHGGGYAGSQFKFLQAAFASSKYGPVNNTIVDVTNGLEPRPVIGAFRITFDPTTNIWEVFYEESTSVLDPIAITTLVGTGANTGFVAESLPYIVFGSYNTSSAYFDNLTVALEYQI